MSEECEEEDMCEQARVVGEACKEMGLYVEYGRSKRGSESQYVVVWVKYDKRKTRGDVQVRFSDHVLPQKYKKNPADYKRRVFESAFDTGHDEVEGDHLQAIEWIAEYLELEPPDWVLRERK